VFAIQRNATTGAADIVAFSSYTTPVFANLTSVPSYTPSFPTAPITLRLSKEGHNLFLYEVTKGPSGKDAVRQLFREKWTGVADEHGGIITSLAIVAGLGTPDGLLTAMNVELRGVEIKPDRLIV